MKLFQLRSVTSNVHELFFFSYEIAPRIIVVPSEVGWQANEDNGQRNVHFIRGSSIFVVFEAR